MKKDSFANKDLDSKGRTNEKKKIRDRVKDIFSPLKIESQGNGIYKLDFETAWETAFTIPAIIGGVVLLGLGIYLLASWPTFSRAWEELKYVFYTAAFALLFFGFLRQQTDDHLLLDTLRQEILHNLKIGLFRWKWKLCSFYEISFLALSGNLITTKTSKYWVYGIRIILKNGKILNLSQSSSDERALESSREQLTTLAKILHLPILNPPPKTSLKILQKPVLTENDIGFTDEKSIQKKNFRIALYIAIAIILFSIIAAFILGSILS